MKLKDDGFLDHKGAFLIIRALPTKSLGVTPYEVSYTLEAASEQLKITDEKIMAARRDGVLIKFISRRIGQLDCVFGWNIDQETGVWRPGCSESLLLLAFSWWQQRLVVAKSSFTV